MSFAVALVLAALLASPIHAQTPIGTEPVEGAEPAEAAESDSVIRNLPPHVAAVPAGFATGVWAWDEEALLSTRALTLLDLLEEVPGIVPLRGGDHGQPAVATAFGFGGGRVRLFLDGVEMPPIDGGAVDLSRVGLGGIGTVRVERTPTELRIELLPRRFADARPETLLEVGTGDLNTNLFRGTFAHPRLLGGSVAVSLDRIDTEGPFTEEPGVSFGAHVRHTLFAGDRFGFAWELRQRTSRRPPDIWAPARVGRRDLSAHARFQATPEILVGAFLQRSSLSEGDGGEPGVDPIPVDEETKTIAGLRASIAWGSLHAELEERRQWGERVPETVRRLSVAAARERLGGASGSVEWETWDRPSGGGGTRSTVHGRVWTAPFAGVSLFAEMGSGERGVPPFHVPPVDEPEEPEEPPLPPEPEVPLAATDRSGIRVGAEIRAWGVHLAVAGIRIEADSLHPVGLPFDRDGVVFPGGERTGLESVAALPLDRLLDGLELRGQAQIWDEDARWRYLPRRTYQAGFSFHDVFLPTGNLEIWTDLGVRGRDPMDLPFVGAGLPSQAVSAPFSQSWYARLQIRVVSVRVFVVWDNFTVRERNQDFPGRVLPATRALYGVRWTMWN